MSIKNNDLVCFDKISPNDNNYYFALITVNREKFHNAINLNVIKKIMYFLEKLKIDNNCRAIIITGAGNKSFIAGADIKLMSQMNPDEAFEYSKTGQDLCSSINSYPKPVIAGINGYALGGGCEIALSCHIRYASKNAILGQPEVGLGIIAGWGGTQRLPMIVGYSDAYNLLITGKKVDSKEALRLGIISDIIDGNLISGIVNQCIGILSNSPNAISKTIESINNTLEFTSSLSMLKERELFKEVFKHNDSKKGINSFLNKEKPKF